MKIAFVYDWVNKFGGAERVLLALHELWPDAPIFTAVYDPLKARWAQVFQVRPSFLNQIPFLRSRHELIPFLTPIAFESFDFSGYDVVLSVTSSDAKSIITHPNTLHICYCLTPARLSWSGYWEYMREPSMGFLNPFIRMFLRVSAPWLRYTDMIASQRPDYYLAISQAVSRRIKTYYKKDAPVMYPPCFEGKPQGIKYKKGEYFLIVSRLVPYKRIDYAISVFNNLGFPLKIIGRGVDKNRLDAMMKDNCEIIDEHLTESELDCYYQNCIALIVPGEEDFGLAAVEAATRGKPVVAFSRTGVKETVIDGVTGELYLRQTEESLKRAVLASLQRRYNPKECQSHALQFSKKRFLNHMKETVELLWFRWSRQ